MFYTNIQQHGRFLFCRGYDDDGRKYSYKELCQPYLFSGPVNFKTDHVTIRGQYVQRKDFDTPREAMQYIKAGEDIANRHVYGLPMHAYTHIYDMYKGDIDYDVSKIRTVNIDIEVAADEGFPDISLADKEITAITFKFNDVYVAMGCQPYKPKQDNVKYYQATDEANLLRKFIEFMKKVDPDVYTGWNIEFFDIPYIINRIIRILGEDDAKQLSPFGIIKEREVFIAGKPNQVYNPLGVAIMDYMQLYKKFTYVMRDSYSLNNIAHVELGEKKLDYSEHDSLFDLYKYDWDKFVDYNVRDVEVVDKLDQKLGLLEQAFAIAYDAKINYQDTFTSVRMWDVIIHNYLLDRGIVVPQFKKVEKLRQAEGAHVKDPQVGMHKWVLSFDLNSLYPHLIMMYNISPEAWVRHCGRTPSVTDIMEGAWDVLREELQGENLTVAATGDLYTRDQLGFLPALMQKMYDDRVVWKDRMLKAKREYEKNPTPELEREISRCNNMQMAKKIQLNSAYGALANEYFRWFDLKFAESVTKSGQLSIRWAERAINEHMNKVNKTEGVDYIVAIDTDSLYIRMDEFIKEEMTRAPTDAIVDFLNEYSEVVLEAVIHKAYEELAEYVHAMENKMVMKRENIGDVAIWTAKKRYVMNVYDSEGVRYEEPKLKIMGLEAVRSSTPTAAREIIKEAFKVIVSSDEKDVQNFIQETRDRFNSLPFDEVAFNRGVSSLDKYGSTDSIYTKGTPIHVRAALMHNHLITSRELNRITPIQEGDKIKFCYLKMPNPIHENVIAAIGNIPPDFELEQYIDYDKQFEKAFLEPIKTVLDAVGWKHEHVSTLDKFFKV